jgi:DNA polymerase-3 subunit alpha
MNNYLLSIADQKQRLTLQNMQMLINKDLIPEEMEFYAKLFSFNKYLKTCKDGLKYHLAPNAVDFISEHFDVDLIEDGEYILQKTWDNLYKKAMEPMRIYLKEHKEEMLEKLNSALYNEVAEKYGKGNISKWEMDSISFYSHEHELALAAADYDDFFTLSEEPEIDYSFPGSNGQEVKIYKLHKIIGTVIDKDKMHNIITLLTPTGVVLVKIYKNQFALYDKQLSQKGDDGKKHVIEASWFKRGTKLMIQGIRRGDNFIPKKTKKSFYPVISKIIDVSDNGELTFQYERAEVIE